MEKKDDTKIETRYDRKMAARKEAAEKERKERRNFNIGFYCIIGLLVLSIVGSVAFTQITKYQAVNDPYVQVGDRTYTEQEYGFYYQLAVNDFAGVYGSLLPYLGLDLTLDHGDQLYDGNNSWEAFFNETAIQNLVQTVAIEADAKANAFEHDTTEEYNEFVANIDTYVSTNSISKATYYEESYGEYANEENIKPLMEESFYVAAYIEKLRADKEITDAEIEAVYDADPSAYDSVNYRTYTFTADVQEGDLDTVITEKMEAAKVEAEAFVARLEAGEAFNDVALDVAAEDKKAVYEEDGSLIPDARMSALPSLATPFLFDDARVTGDIDLVVDEENHSYTVNMFESRVKADTVNDEIKESLIDEYIVEYVEALVANYELVELKNELVTLVEAVTEETEASEETEVSE